MAGGEDEAVAVRPVGVRRVVPHDVSGRGRRPPERAPSPCPDGLRWPAGPRPSRACGSSRSTAARPFSRHCRHVTCNHTHMAVLIASALRKELAGERAVRRRQLQGRAARPARALPGPNGAGKTTLPGCSSARPAGRRRARVRQRERAVALHDQRPPLERGADAARVRPRRARATSSRWRRSCGRLEQAMAAGRPRAGDAATATPRHRRGSSTPAATRGATARRPSCAGSASRSEDLDRPLTTFSGGELTRASLGARARRRPRPAAARRADEPPRRREPRVARARARRRSTRP